MRSLIPQRVAGIVVVDSSGQATLQTSAGQRVCSLNESALAIWELCDGSTTADEMAHAIVELCSVPFDQACDDVERTLEALDHAGVIDLSDRARRSGRGDRSDTWSRSTT